MIEQADFKMICKQMMLQATLTFLAKLVQAINVNNDLYSGAKVERLIEDFSSGFDRRLSLMVTNHLLCKFKHTVC